MPNVDLTKNKKQAELFYTIIQEINRHNSKEGEKVDPGEVLRYFFYGGGIRGGKTYLLLFVCALAASKIYKNMRIHIIRQSYPDLVRTTIPSMEKILKGKTVRWKRNTSDYFVEFSSGSRIYFVSENYKNDKDLDWMKGLETNWIVLEQIEELQEATFNKALERLGSWYDVQPCVPPPFILASFNPTYNWVKKRIHDQFLNGLLKPPFHYVQALASDNEFVTQDQWDAWSNLDTKSYNRFILGDWSVEIEGRFMWAFNESQVKEVEIDDTENLVLSFDFNVDPMTCVICQTDKWSYVRCVKAIKIQNSDVYEMCKVIRAWLDENKLDNRLIVTGDASGRNRNVSQRLSINNYQIIMQELGIMPHHIHVPKANPRIADSRTFCNSIHEKFPIVEIAKGEADDLVDDLRFTLVETGMKGEMQIKKTGANIYAGVDNSKIGHLLDGWRYFLHYALSHWIRVPKS